MRFVHCAFFRRIAAPLYSSISKWGMHNALLPSCLFQTCTNYKWKIYLFYFMIFLILLVTCKWLKDLHLYLHWLDWYNFSLSRLIARFGKKIPLLCETILLAHIQWRNLVKQSKKWTICSQLIQICACFPLHACLGENVIESPINWAMGI